MLVKLVILLSLVAGLTCSVTAQICPTQKAAAKAISGSVPLIEVDQLSRLVKMQSKIVLLDSREKKNFK